LVPSSRRGALAAREPEDGLAEVGDRTKALDMLLEHRTRLGACVLLSQERGNSFPRLRDLLEETDGNLGAHLRKLEQAGYVTVAKEFVDRKPVTRYTLARAGKAALREHLAAPQYLLDMIPSSPGASDKGTSRE
jgi:DNA-binding MarR family transcriptional regulator